MPRRGHTRGRGRANPTGRLEAHARGYGFVKTAEGSFFVPAAKMNGAFDGDIVEVAALPRERSKHAAKTEQSRARGACERPARVVRVVMRAHSTIVGRYEVAEPFGVVVPADPRIAHDVFTERRANPDVPDGAIVRVRITEYPTRHSAATGVIEEVMGDDDDEHLPVDLIIAHHRIETAFTQAALDQAAACAVDAQGAIDAGYRDLRGRFAFTVDPDDARDFDDAVSWERLDGASGAGAWRLGVHIADVSHYVPWGSALDMDARERATSVYLVDRVVPMLPEKLSNDVCSLAPGQDRRAMTLDMAIDDAGRIVGVEAFPSVIRSRARLTYGQAQDLLDEGRADGVEAQLGVGLAQALRGLARFADARAKRRERAGGMAFEVPEAKVRLDAQGAPVRIELRRKTPATALIEEAMIAANECVAERLHGAGFPCLYRVHEAPDAQNMKALVPVLEGFGWFSRINRNAFSYGEPHAVAATARLAQGRPEEQAVSMLVLRAMKRAVYQPQCDGHYGLASACYCHFTSPIRRYPDIVVHRMLKELSFGKTRLFDQEVSMMARIGERSSAAERTADEAARESQEVKIVEYLEGSVGREFEAWVAGVASCGLFVRLENTASGLVPTESLGREYFAFDPVRRLLVGTDSGRVFKLGQRVRVVLAAADHRTRRLDFRLAEGGEP